MVARFQGEHDHGDGPVCPGCEFKAELTDELLWAVTQDEQTWYRVTGEIKNLAAGVLTSLTLLRATRLDPDGADGTGEHARIAAITIFRLGAEIDHLWHRLVEDDDDGQDDD